MESLFYEKKLITDNIKVKDLSFYHPNNIFILGVDELSNLDTFIKKPYHKVSSNIINYYSFKEWLNRFN